MSRYLLLIALIGFSSAIDLRKLEHSKNLEYDETYIMKSINYPEDSDAWTEEKWTITAEKGKTLGLNCKDLVIQFFDNGSCNDYVATFTDGSKTDEFCGTTSNYKFKTSTNMLTVTLKTGKLKMGFLNCQVSVIGNRSKRSVNSHLDLVSEEIDSSEFGGPPGEKETTCPCGWANKKNERIVGGKETKINEYPFVVRLLTGNSLCGGSIISKKHILTATHCIYGKQPKEIRVYVGEHNTKQDNESSYTKIHKVSKIIEHSEYSPATTKHDIAILVLSSSITFNQYVGPVCLPNGELPIKNKYVKTMGWGREYNALRIGSTVLRHVNLRVLSTEMCVKAWGNLIKERNPTQFCTWGRGKSACSGDSGGPVVWLDPETNRYTLAGIVSFGKPDSIGDCGNRTPRVSTKVSAYLEWISNAISGSKHWWNSATNVCFKK